MNADVLHLTPCELAARWRTALGTLANQRCKKEGPPYLKFGKRILYPLDEIERYEQARLRLPRGQP